MITLIIADIGWLEGAEENPKDYCAHGKVKFKVNETSFVKPEDGVWTVSAAALYLLRTIAFDHTRENDVTQGNHLFPCCAFKVRPSIKQYKVKCSGCANGIDIEVRHEEGIVHLSSHRGEEVLTESQWKKSVLHFAEYVRAFHVLDSPKAKIQNDGGRRGWKAFWQEWDERVAEARKLTA